MPRQSFFSKFRKSRMFLLIVLTIIILAILLLVKGPQVFNEGNAVQIMNRLSYMGLFITATACLLLSGGIDFSLGSQATFGAIIFATLCVKFPGTSWVLFALVALCIGIVMGLINAFFSQVLNLMPFICTIGISSVWLGIANWYTKALVVTVNNASFSKIATARIPGTPIPLTFIFMILVVILYSFIVKRTNFGRSVLVVGGNPSAARLAGINPKRVKSVLYINASVLGMIGGLMYTAQLKSAGTSGIPQAMVEMNGLTASMLGGVSFAGGAGGLGGAFFGILLIQILAYSMQIMVDWVWLVQFVNGMLLVVALTIDTIATSRRMKKLGMKTSGSGMVMPGMAR